MCVFVETTSLVHIIGRVLYVLYLNVDTEPYGGLSLLLYRPADPQAGEGWSDHQETSDGALPRPLPQEHTCASQGTSHGCRWVWTGATHSRNPEYHRMVLSLEAFREGKGL